MKTLAAKCLWIVLSGIFLFSPAVENPVQQIAHNVSVVNIEVAVRVYEGNRFVDNLTIDDFELYENDIPQKIEAIYRIQKSHIVDQGPKVEPERNTVEMKTGAVEPIRSPDPKIERRVFLLYFEMEQYPSPMNAAIDYLFENVIGENDTLLIVTPTEQWKFVIGKENADQRRELSEALKKRLKKTLRLAGSYTRELIGGLKSLMVYDDEMDEMDGMGSLLPMKVSEICDQLVAHKVLSEKRFDELAGFLKPIVGQKHVFLFYQEETYSVPFKFKSIFERKFLDRLHSIDKKRIQELFSNAQTTVHFAFLRKDLNEKTDVEYSEANPAAPVGMSGDIFQTFRDLAITTGGIVETTRNPRFAMQKVTTAAENYYLLYYRPAAPAAGKEFKNIKVRVKNANYKVISRSGYFER